MLADDDERRHVDRRQRLEHVTVGLPQHAPGGQRQALGAAVHAGAQLVAAGQAAEAPLVEVRA